MDTARLSAPPDSADILSQQAAGLLAGVDRTAELLAAAPAPARPELAELLHLARRLNSAMPLVAPRSEFTAGLRAQLDQARPAAEAARRHEKEQRLRWMAGLGGAVYLLSLGFVTYRTAQAVGSKVAPWAKARLAPAGSSAEPMSAAPPA